MGNILPSFAPMPRAFLGYDGTDFRVCSVDAAGKLQVGIAAIALPAGAATEATLATRASEAKLELCRVLLASLDGVDFATQTTLAALLTELALKADLTETQPVSAVALPLPAGAATEASLATMATEAKLETVRVLLASLDGVDFATQVTSAALLTELALKADLTERQPVRGEDQLFSFADQLMDKSSGVPSAADGYRESTAVPANTVWVVTQVCAFDGTTATLQHTYLISVGAQSYNFYSSVAAFAVAQPSSLATHLYLQTGDVMRVYFQGALADDTCTLVVHGCSMTKET